MEPSLAATKALDKVTNHTRINSELLLNTELAPKSMGFLSMIQFLSELSESYKNVLTYFVNFKNIIDQNLTKCDEFFASFMRIIVKKIEEPTKPSYHYDLEVELGALSYKAKEFQLLITNLKNLASFLADQVPKAKRRPTDDHDFSLLSFNMLMAQYLQVLQQGFQEYVRQYQLNVNITEIDMKKMQATFYDHLDRQCSKANHKMHFFMRLTTERDRFIHNIMIFCSDMQSVLNEKRALLIRVKDQLRICIERRLSFCTDLQSIVTKADPSIFSTYTPNLEANQRYQMYKKSFKERQEAAIEVTWEEPINDFTASIDPQSARKSHKDQAPLITVISGHSTLRVPTSASARKHTKASTFRENHEPSSARPHRPSTSRSKQSGGPLSANDLRLAKIELSARSSSPNQQLARMIQSMQTSTQVSPRLVLKTDRSHNKRPTSAARQFSSPQKFYLKPHNPESIREAASKLSTLPTVQDTFRGTEATQTLSTAKSRGGKKNSIKESIGADINHLSQLVVDLLDAKFSSQDTAAAELSKINGDKIDRLDHIKGYAEDMLQVYNPLEEILQGVTEKIIKCNVYKEIAQKIEVEIVPRLIAIENYREKIKGSYYNSVAEVRRMLPEYISKISTLLDNMTAYSHIEQLNTMLAEPLSFYTGLKERLSKCLNKIQSRLFEAKKFVLQSYQEDFKRLVLLHKEFAKFLLSIRRKDDYLINDGANQAIDGDLEYDEKIVKMIKTLNFYAKEKYSFEIPQIHVALEMANRMSKTSKKFKFMLGVVLDINRVYSTHDYANFTTFKLKEGLTSLDDIAEEKSQTLQQQINSSALTNEDVREMMKRTVRLINSLRHFISQATIFELSVTEMFNNHLEKISRTITHEFDTAQYTATMLQSKMEKLITDFIYDNFKNNIQKQHPIFEQLQEVFTEICEGDSSLIDQLINDLSTISQCQEIWNRSFKRFNTLTKYVQIISLPQNADEELERIYQVVGSHSTNFESNYDERFMRDVVETKALTFMREKLAQIKRSIELLQSLLGYNQLYNQKTVEFQLAAFDRLNNAFKYFSDEWEAVKRPLPEFSIERELGVQFGAINNYFDLFVTTLDAVISHHNDFCEQVEVIAGMDHITDSLNLLLHHVAAFVDGCKNVVGKFASYEGGYISTALKKCVFDHNNLLLSAATSMEQDFKRFVELETFLTEGIEKSESSNAQKLIIELQNIVLNIESRYMKFELLQKAFESKSRQIIDRILAFQLRYAQPEIERVLKKIDMNNITSKMQEKLRCMQALALVLVDKIDEGKYASVSDKIKSREVLKLYSEFLLLIERVSMLTSKNVGSQISLENLESREKLSCLRDLLRDIPAIIRGSLSCKMKKKQLQDLLQSLQQHAEYERNESDIDALFSGFSWRSEECFTKLGVTYDVESKSEDEARLIYKFIKQILNEDAYLADLDKITEYQEQSKAMMNQFEICTHAEVNYAWLDLFSNTHVLIEWCQTKIQTVDTVKEDFKKDLDQALKDAEVTIEKVGKWASHQEIQKNIDLFEQRRNILISTKRVMETFRELIDLDVYIVSLTNTYRIDNNIDDLFLRMEETFEDVHTNVDFLDRYTTDSTNDLFSQILMNMKLQLERIRIAYDCKRGGLAEIHAIDRCVFQIQKSFEYILNCILRELKAVHAQYQTFITRIFTVKRTEITLRIVKLVETDYSCFILHVEFVAQELTLQQQFTITITLSKPLRLVFFFCSFELTLACNYNS